jgi:dolichyl-phosphate beta-glucosyltransferase
MNQTGQPIGVSVVIPAYNEAARLPSYLQQTIAYLDRRGDRYEVLVVDDGSSDGTAEIVREISGSTAGVGVYTLPKNRGKGHAVRVGMRRTRGHVRLIADADGATPIAELPRLEAALHRGADVAIGSRALRDDSVVRQTQLHRRVAGGVFNLIVRCIGVKNITDTQCGFKLFRGEVADDLFGAARTDGFGFDVEVLLLAQRKGYRIIEVPVNWEDQPGSKVRVVNDGVRMVGQIALARWRIGFTEHIDRASPL